MIRDHVPMICKRCRGSGIEPSIITTMVYPCEACGGWADTTGVNSYHHPPGRWVVTDDRAATDAALAKIGEGT